MPGRWDAVVGCKEGPSDEMRRRSHPDGGDAWPGGYQVSISIALPNLQNVPRGYRRPYAAVWVENSDGKAVASILALMGLDHTKLTYFFQGRDYRLTDVAGKTDLLARLRS